MNILRTIIIILLATSAASAQSYQIDWSVIASGGGHSESANHQADGTIGQAVVGQSTSENYILQAGFWVGLPSGSDCVYIPGDCDNDGVPATLPDAIAMIGMYRGTVVHPYECDCTPHGETFGATADPNGNCIADELPDVVTEIGIYRGTVEASGCEDCPGQGRLLPGGGNQPLVIPSLKAKARRKVSQ